jgi:LacI family transcriptional regulator
MPTIRDVAQLAGVSPTTVSYILNGTRYVSPETEARIRTAIKELNYKPDYIARSLRAKRTMTVGMIVSDITNPFYADIVRGAEDALSARHYSLVLCNTDEAPTRELEALNLLHQKKVDGLIAVATGTNAEAFYEILDSGLPIVLVDRCIPGDRLCTILVDDEQGAYEAVELLIQLGHRRIGLIMGKAGISTTDHRRNGYEKALQAAGISIEPDLEQTGHSTIEGGAAAARVLLDLDPPLTAIFATNNLMIVGLFLTIKQRGLRCPEDIAVVGFDDVVWLSAFSPALTTIAQPSYDLGSQAAELLWKMMDEKKAAIPCQVVLPAQLVIRESSGREIKTVSQ